MVAFRLKPGGAGPDRSVKTPTIWGRKSYPPRSPFNGAPGSSLSLPFCRPTNSPVTLSAWASKVSFWQDGLSTWLIGATTTGVLRTTTTRSLFARWISRPRSTAFGACFGTVESSTVSVAFRPAAALHGMLMLRSVGT